MLCRNSSTVFWRDSGTCLFDHVIDARVTTLIRSWQNSHSEKFFFHTRSSLATEAGAKVLLRCRNQRSEAQKIGSIFLTWSSNTKVAHCEQRTAYASDYDSELHLKVCAKCMECLLSCILSVWLIRECGPGKSPLRPFTAFSRFYVSYKSSCIKKLAVARLWKEFFPGRKRLPLRWAIFSVRRKEQITLHIIWKTILFTL